MASSSQGSPTASLHQDQPTIAPVSGNERISALDTVRGFALLGILLMNICSFGLPQSAYNSPTPAGGATGLNLLAWCLIAILADGKMRAIFSIAFGASIYLLTERLSRKGAAADAADIHYRRILWLALFGMIHAYLLWDGDILFSYALMGLLLYPLRKLSPRALLAIAGIMVIVMFGLSFHRYSRIKQRHLEYVQIQTIEKSGDKLTEDQQKKKRVWEQIMAEFNPSAEDLEKEAHAHLGSYLNLLKFRVKGVYQGHSLPLYRPFPYYDFLAFMLIGIAFMKLGVLTGSRSAGFYAWMALLSFGIGLAWNTSTVWWAVKQNLSIESLNFSELGYQLGRLTAFGYIALIMLAIKAGVASSATKTLASVGQMAFSNYIFTSLACTTVFEGYGFGLFGKLQRYQLYGIVLLVWTVILVVSPIWLRHFRFGPIEWAWRSLTYWKKQPFRIRDSAIAG